MRNTLAVKLILNPRTLAFENDSPVTSAATAMLLAALKEPEYILDIPVARLFANKLPNVTFPYTIFPNVAVFENKLEIVEFVVTIILAVVTPELIFNVATEAFVEDKLPVLILVVASKVLVVIPVVILAAPATSNAN